MANEVTPSAAPDKRPLTVGVASALVLMFSLNLLLDAAVWWLYRQPGTGTRYVRFLTLGVPVCQVLMLGFWLALGTGKWYWRLAIAFPLSLIVGYAAECGAGLGGTFRPLQEVSVVMGASLLVLLLATFAIGLPVRQLRGWRLTRLRSANGVSTTQFRTEDLMLWLFAAAAPLAVARFMLSVDVNSGEFLIILVVLLPIGILPVLWPALRTAFASRRRIRWTVVVLSWTLLYGGIFGAAKAYLFYRQMQILRPGFILPAGVYLEEVVEPLLFFLAAALIPLINGMVLSRLGWQLVRPGTRPVEV